MQVVAVDAEPGARPTLRISWAGGGQPKRYHVSVVRQKLADKVMVICETDESAAVRGLRAEVDRLHAKLKTATERTAT